MRPRVAMALLVLACTMTIDMGCTMTVDPPVVAPPADGPGTCETAYQNLQHFGGCNVLVPTWVSDCNQELAHEEEIGLRLPVGCLTAAKSCEEANACK